jgi:hypothetical protein
MNYSVSIITEPADCNVLLASAAKEKADLIYKKLTVERVTQRYAETAIEVDAELQGVIVEIEAVTTIISVLPEGSTKEGEQDRKVKLEYKKFLLENRKESYGAVAFLERELDLARVEKELEEVEAFIVLITNHAATL